MKLQSQQYEADAGSPTKPRSGRAVNPKRLIRESFSWILRWSGLALAMRTLLWRDRVAVLVYHDPKPSVIDAHLSYLKRVCDLVALSDVQQPGRGRPRAVITLDDGHRGNAALLPVFIKHGIKPTIFICSGVVARPREFWWLNPVAAQKGIERLKRLPDSQRMAELASSGYSDTAFAKPKGLSAREIASMLPHVDFESHTKFHPVLTNCDDDRCLDEIAGSKHQVESLTGRTCDHFAYPNGSYGEREIALLKTVGYKTARTCDAGWNDAHTDPFRLRALEIGDDATLGWFAVQLTGLPAFVRDLRGGGRFRGRRAQL
jgi:peptidoglycan/xylan/chitin deacetylase (PgdA/CDA1 family)